MKLSDYYIAIFSPLLIIVALSALGFSKFIGIYVLLYYIYRCFLDYFRLKTKGIVSKVDRWKFIVPIWTFIYFRQLYFK